MKRTETFEAEIQKFGNSYVVVVPAFIINAQKKFAEGELVKVRLSEVQQ